MQSVPVEMSDEVHETEVREPREPAADDEPDILSGSPEFVDEETDGENLWFEKALRRTSISRTTSKLFP